MYSWGRIFTKERRMKYYNLVSICFSMSAFASSFLLHILQQPHILAKSLSSGFRERKQIGRNFQFWSFFGSQWGFLFWSTLMMATNTSRHRIGIPTPARTSIPAREIPKIASGKRKNIKIKYKTANQRYLAVVLPRNFAIAIGKRMKVNG